MSNLSLEKGKDRYSTKNAKDEGSYILQGKQSASFSGVVYVDSKGKTTRNLGEAKRFKSKDDAIAFAMKKYGADYSQFYAKKI